MQSALDVTVIGDINIDIITSPIESFPEKDSQIIVKDMDIEVGGSAANFAYACSRLGLKTRFLGKIGQDHFTDLILQKMSGVDMRIKLTPEKNGITFATDFRDKTRSFMTYQGVKSTFSLRDVNLADIQGKVLYVGGYNLLDGLRPSIINLLRYAKAQNMTTCLDPNWDPKAWTPERIEDLRQILEFVDIFFPDLEEAKAFTGMENIDDVVSELQKFKSIVILKMGDQGCRIIDNRQGTVQHIHTFNVGALDTTGAGDVFNAGFIHTFINSESKSLEESAKYGTLAAIHSIQDVGRRMYPSEKDMELLVQEYIF